MIPGDEADAVAVCIRARRQFGQLEVIDQDRLAGEDGDVVVGDGERGLAASAQAGPVRVGQSDDHGLVLLFAGVVDRGDGKGLFGDAEREGEGGNRRGGEVIAGGGRAACDREINRHGGGAGGAEGDNQAGLAAFLDRVVALGEADGEGRLAVAKEGDMVEIGGALAAGQGQGIGLHLGEGEAVIGGAAGLVGIVAEEGGPGEAEEAPTGEVVHEFVGEALGGVARHGGVEVVAEDEAVGAAAVAAPEPEAQAVVAAPILAAEVVARARAPAGGVVGNLQHVVGVQAGHGVGGHTGGVDEGSAAVVAVLEPGGGKVALEIVHRLECDQAHLVEGDGGGAVGQGQGVGLHLGEGEAVVRGAAGLVGPVAHKRAPRDEDVPPAGAVVGEFVDKAFGGVAGHGGVGVVAEDEAEGAAGGRAAEPEAEAIVLAPILAAEVVARARAPAGGVVGNLQHVVGIQAGHGVGGDDSGVDKGSAAVVAVLEPGGGQVALEIVEDGGIAGRLGEGERAGQGQQQEQAEQQGKEEEAMALRHG